MIKIRYGVFETNSSSVHSLVLCNISDYDKWINGEVLFNINYRNDYTWKRWDANAHKYIEKGVPPQFVTKEQAACYDENYPYPPAKESNWGGLNLEFQNKDGEWCERNFITFEEYQDSYAYEFETFSDSYTTPGGEEVIAFGYWGRDG